MEIQQLNADQNQMQVWSVEPSDLPKVLQGLKNLPLATLLGDPKVVPMAERVAWRYLQSFNNRDEPTSPQVNESRTRFAGHEKFSPDTAKFSMSVRVAARFLNAAFFSVGDEILYGKYKNKRGRIVQFGLNDKGQPLVEIEPIPKGRKKNKMMGLFKIWNVAAIAKAQQKEATMDPLTTRVAGRFVVATGIPLGKTWESGSVRFHRWRDMYTVTELTNAGKRGKKVRELVVEPRTKDDQGWMERMSQVLPEYTTYDQVLAFFKDLAHDYPGEVSIHESEKRGVDVNPGGTTKVNLETDTGLKITSEPMSFSVTKTDVFQGRTGPFNQDRTYWPRDKKGAAVFYNWLKANLSQANRMTIEDFQKLWDELKIPYTSH